MNKKLLPQLNKLETNYIPSTATTEQFFHICLRKVRHDTLFYLQERFNMVNILEEKTVKFTFILTH